MNCVSFHPCDPAEDPHDDDTRQEYRTQRANAAPVQSRCRDQPDEATGQDAVINPHVSSDDRSLAGSCGIADFESAPSSIHVRQQCVSSPHFTLAMNGFASAFDPISYHPSKCLSSACPFYFFPLQCISFPLPSSISFTSTVRVRSTFFTRLKKTDIMFDERGDPLRLE
jgi:hypothetical protein